MGGRKVFKRMGGEADTKAEEENGQSGEKKDMGLEGLLGEVESSLGNMEGQRGGGEIRIKEGHRKGRKWVKKADL